MMIFKKLLHDVKKQTKLYAYAASSQDRFEELARAANDIAYQEKLFREMGI